MGVGVIAEVDFRLDESLTKVSVQPVSALYTRASTEVDVALVAAMRENLMRLDDDVAVLAEGISSRESSVSDSDSWAIFADLAADEFFMDFFRASISLR